MHQLFPLQLFFSDFSSLHFLCSAGEGGAKMEGGAVGAASKDDGGKVITRRV